MKSVDILEVNGRKIGGNNPCYIIAEMSANHGHDFDHAVALVEAAKEAGADAIKLQTYTPDTLTIDSEKEFFQIGAGTVWAGRTFYDLYAEAYTPWDWQPKLKKLADSIGIDLFSSPFDFSSVKFLEGMDVPAYKISSFELVDLPLIRQVAATGKPVIMSTGMATIDEIAEAVAAVHSTGNKQVALLKCTSAYPADPAGMNLRTIPDLAGRFDVVTGLSDHTLGTTAATVAVSLGAKIIEKHLTLSRDISSPDKSFSVDPHEFKQLVSAIREAEAALGEASYSMTVQEEASRIFRRSIFVVADIAQGEVLTRDNIRSIRPGNGLPPKHLDEVLGCCAATDLERGTPLEWKYIKGRKE